MTPFDRWQRALLVLCLVAGAWIRLHDLDYNTIFQDEWSNLSMGRAAVHGGSARSTIFSYVGWYLFPVLAWVSDQLGGVVGMRAMSGLFGVGVLVVVSLLTRRLFGNVAAVGAVFLATALSPFVHAGRVSFRESGTLFFLGAALLFFVEAWGTDRRRYWAYAALNLLAAFLCKHPLAMYIPPMVALALIAGDRARRWFAAPLVVVLVVYLVYYRAEMIAMMGFMAQIQIGAPRDMLTQIYLWQRLDVWALVLLSAAGLVVDRKEQLMVRASFLSAALLFITIHVVQRTDWLTYKQAAYPLLFLLPLAAHALRLFAERLVADARSPRAPWAVVLSSLALAVPISLAGRDWQVSRADVGLRWPNNAFLADYVRSWAGPTTRVLTDEQTLEYALSPDLEPDQISHAYFFAYGGQTGSAAYAAAVRDGVFDLIALNGASFGASDMLRSAIGPQLAPRYVMTVDTRDSLTGNRVTIYRRIEPRSPSPVVRGPLQIGYPVTGSVTEAGPVTVRGVLHGRSGGETVRVDVFTNQWWPQGEPAVVDRESGAFEATVYLGGGGYGRCHHVIRARAYSSGGRLLGTVFVTEIGRRDAASTDPECDRE